MEAMPPKQTTKLVHPPAGVQLELPISEARSFKLTTELVPLTSWYSNMRSAVSRATWDTLRRATYAAYGYQCGVCAGAGMRLNCHERWEYDDIQKVQRLAGFIALCDLCHHVKHLGHARRLADEGKLDYERVVEHFTQVNGCERTAFEEYRRTVFDQWHRRSKFDWRVDLGAFASLVDQSPGASGQPPPPHRKPFRRAA
jgi:hypothetical protein